jgi:hypothetical protein
MATPAQDDANRKNAARSTALLDTPVRRRYRREDRQRLSDGGCCLLV